MLDHLRIALYTLLLIIGFFLFQAWEKEHSKEIATAASTLEATMPAGHLPAVANSTATTKEAPATPTPELPAQQVGKLVKVKTDVLDVTIDTLGGDIISVNLPRTLSHLKTTRPMSYSRQSQTRYIAESGLLSKIGPILQRPSALYNDTPNYKFNPVIMN